MTNDFALNQAKSLQIKVPDKNDFPKDVERRVVS